MCSFCGRAGECVCISEENKGKPVLFFLPPHEIPLLLGRRRRSDRPNGAEFVKEESLMPPPEKKGRFSSSSAYHKCCCHSRRGPLLLQSESFEIHFFFIFFSSDLSSTMLLWRSRSERKRDAYKRNAHNKHVRTYYTHQWEGEFHVLYCKQRLAEFNLYHYILLNLRMPPHIKYFSLF